MRFDAGAIGELKLIRTSFCYRTRKIEGNIRFSRELAGGGLMDIGCYCIDFSRLFAGAEPINAQVSGHLHESGVDDLAAGTITFSNGVFASFVCGMTVQADNTAYLCGSEGYIAIPVPWKPLREGAGFAIGRGTPPRMDAIGKPAPATTPSSGGSHRRASCTASKPMTLQPPPSTAGRLASPAANPSAPCRFSILCDNVSECGKMSWR